MDYAIIKGVHIASAITSYALFFVRGVWMIGSSPRLAQRWVHTIPHIVDTVLLLSAITMAVMIRQYPFAAGWLTAKVIALMFYIVLGTVALKRGRSRAARIRTWIAAQFVFAYIVVVALTKDPFPLM